MSPLRRGLSALSAIQMACAGREGAELAYVLDMFLVVERKDEAQ